MVTHAKLQYYRHNYGLVCITGSLGCRWHRYKQSLRDNRKVSYSQLKVGSAVMVGLYISPVFIDSPCVVATTKLPPKPFIIGHRGASGIAPENTMISFEIADQYGVLGYEADVRISFDGVPFLLHDSTFARTTNIANVFPDLIKTDCSMFNISQIQQLDAGSWFVETDPMVTMSSVSSKNKVLYKQQKIPTLLEFLKFANKTGKVVVFDFLLPSKSHPFYSDMGPFHNAIHESGIDPKTVWWLMSVEDKLSEGYTPVVREYSPPDVLRQKHIYNTNIEFSSISIDQIREYRANNITTNIHTVNKGWFLSLFWCVGTTSISTNNCHTLSQMERPVWTLLPRNYLILWVTVDVLSAILVIVIFIVQRIQRQGTKYSPESQSLNWEAQSQQVQQNARSHQRADSYRRNRRAMKEKLLMRDVASELFDVEPEVDDLGIESNYTVQSADGRVMAATFHQERNGYQTSYQDPSRVQSDSIVNL
ncbi:Glycerophosphodiester phosphodiesterase domain-containing protein 5 [Mizuhopecten yessoensis]|uniref:Glycerophosphodiester phosphodiesterase domain-containing protein 5 n=1 Tax=Mizuhopecten yessoensis TaxID=6573 RepID=A0A210PRV8_MIZYE|nr:Glycerophosphodiester phosphodiesterase domain-containing protein 5 [Mizuhopecten yessoensis]